VDAVVLIRQQFGVKVPVAELTRVLRQGGVLRQDNKPKADYEALFWHTGTAYEVFGHRIEALYRLYESTKLRLEMAARARLRMDPPGGPELPFDGSTS
jgi:predicted lipoprotein